MTPEQVFALVAALSGQPDPAAFATLKAGGFDPAYPVEVTPCARPVAPVEIDGKTIVCGRISVPYDHDDPSSHRITIAFNLYKAHSLSPEPDPVIYLHGGPGDGTVSRVARTIGFFEHLRARRDIIAIDERGVDTSAPEMDCYATLGEELEPIIKLRPQGDFGALGPDFVKGCLQELKDRGIDIAKINTRQNALDVPNVIAALGYKSWNIYGVSYGTKLTQEILRQNPPGLRSVVIDGNAPPWLPLYSMFWQTPVTAISLSLAPCEADPVCAAAYPDITKRTFALIEKLIDAPVATGMGPLGGLDFFAMISARGQFDSQFAGLTTYLPLIVTQLEKGDATTLDQVLAGTLLPKADTPADVRARALAAGLSQAEMAQVDAMLAAAEHIRIAEETVTTAAQALEAGRTADATGQDLAELVDREMGKAMAALPDDARIAAWRDYLGLRYAEPSREALLTLISDHLTGDTADEVAGLIGQLDGPGIARVFARVQIDNQQLLDDVEGLFQTFVYACQEDFSDGWNTIDKFRTLATEDGTFGPKMVENLAQNYSMFFTACEAFDKHPRENWTVPVSSDLLILSMNGEIDPNTSALWGKLAIEHDPHGIYVLIPESGHGTIRFSQCARDITAAFIDNPNGPLDTSCVGKDRLPIMLPDGTLHVLEP